MSERKAFSSSSLSYLHLSLVLNFQKNFKQYLNISFFQISFRSSDTIFEFDNSLFCFSICIHLNGCVILPLLLCCFCYYLNYSHLTLLLCLSIHAKMKCFFVALKSPNSRSARSTNYL